MLAVEWVGCQPFFLKKDITFNHLTPNLLQKRYINQKKPDLIVHNLKFEELDTTDKFGTIINSESLQYINLDEAFKKVDSLLT